MNPDSRTQPIEKVTYPQIREGIQTGDLLLFKGRSWVSRLIARVLCRPYSHVGLLVRRDDHVLVYQALMRGVCKLPAREAVSQYDGLVDWWSLRRDKAEKLDLDRLCQLADAGVGRSFGIWGMLKLGWAVLTGRDRGRPETDPSVQEMFCSQYISHCFRLAGFDPCPAFADHQTSPADLETCGFFERRQRLLDGRHLMAGQLLGAPGSVRPAA
jgi:hypothetical protein